MAQDTDTSVEPSPEASGQGPEGDAPADADAAARGEHAHPSDLEYIKVAIVLAAITLAEVLVYYVEALEDFLVPILLVMSAFKFVIVVLWFMHLRFDSRLFRRFFVTGLLLALFVYLIVLTTFHFWN